MPLYLQSALNGCPGNTFSELERHHVLYCTICSMSKQVRIYPMHLGLSHKVGVYR